MASALTYIVPFAFASGLNLYATIAVLGLCSHYRLVTLPEQFRAFDHPVVITVAVAALGDASPAVKTVAALLGGSVAMTTHLTKAGARAAANTSPEPFSNWILSFGEDAVAVGMSYVALQHPVAAFIAALILLAL